MNENELVPVNNQPSVIPAELSVEAVAEQAGKVQQLMRKVMHEGEHYGTIPGMDSKKNSLFKAGAEKLCFTFRLIPKFDITRNDLPDGHREYIIVCSLNNQITGEFMGQGVGSASTMENKYRYRKAHRKCPNCGMESIIRGKKEYGGGWLCFKKSGGCGAKYDIDDPRITEQKEGKIENPDIADTYNTVLKMAKKRSHIDATITACAASDIFTQDLEDLAHVEPVQQKREYVTHSRPNRNKMDNETGSIYGQIMALLNAKADGHDVLNTEEKIKYKKRADSVVEDIDGLNNLYYEIKQTTEERGA